MAQDPGTLLPLLTLRAACRFPDTVHITVSITEYTTPGGKEFRGVASGYLQGLVPNQTQCRVFVRESAFRLPKSPDTPVVMVGPGTGVAPMRALLQEREEQALRAGKPLGSLGANTLYFGCQSQNRDFIYRDELEAFQKSKTLTGLHLAFSRDQSDKVYVQHHLARDLDAASLMDSLDKGAHVYVCGATNMGESSDSQQPR